MTKQITTGVIVARFQTSRLTPGHVHLLNTALLQNDEVLLFLGCAAQKNSESDPIDFVWRQSMVQSDPRLFIAGRKLIIMPVYDKGDDKVWSEQVHSLIDLNRTHDSHVRLYGSRDSSFLNGFRSEYEKVELLPFAEFSATELRGQIAKQYPSGREGDDKIREGLIIASHQRYAAVFSAVDNAILERREGVLGVWMGRKPAQERFRFIGGFTEPTSANDEEDVIREGEEETGLITAAPHYIGNLTVDDWRYRRGKDKIRTRLFATIVVGGKPVAADDIAELKFVPIEMMPNLEVVCEHKPIMNMFLEWTRSARGVDYIAQYICKIL